MGRWILNRKLRPNTTYTPYMRPAPPYIIDLLPPKAYPGNSSTSLCTKFVHTSTNKIRCPVNVVTWTPEARRILTGSTSGEFTLWNGLTFNFETILQAHDTAITAMRFTHSGAYLASTDKSGVIKYFEPNMNNLTAWQGTNSGNREAIRGLSFSPDDQRFVTGSDDSSLRIWSFKESRGENILSGHGWDVKCVEWHPTKGLIVSGSKDSSVKFWDPRTGTCLSTLHQHKNTIQAIAWSPNGNLLATGSRDQTVRVFDIRALKEFRVLKGHKKEVCSVAWHPVHPVLVSGGSEGSIMHWDLSGADMVDSIAAPTPAPGSANAKDLKANASSPLPMFAAKHTTRMSGHLPTIPLGHILVSGSNDHTTRFWSRERPGDNSSSFAAGGEKPPEEMGGGDQDEDDEMGGGMSVPGFGFGSGGGEVLPPGFGTAGGGAEPRKSGAGSGRDISGGWWKEPERDSGPSSYGQSASASGPPPSGNSGGYGDSADDFAIPGFGGSSAPPGFGSSGRGGGGEPRRDEFGRERPDRDRDGFGGRNGDDGGGRGGGGRDRDDWGRGGGDRYGQGGGRGGDRYGNRRRY
ncbi:WD40 repeat-like protein [Coprinopsis sp. MPI-PUGE-AT-0042]|nr:WD40 repeat-like protein [Coprinopsis sp. MPI-PUGE-AT-0042]